jgi:pentatricopeptide repeat protein
MLGLLEKAWCWFDKFHYRMNSECFSTNIDAFEEERYIVLAEKAFIWCLKKKMLSVLVCNVMTKSYGLVEKLDEACEIVDGMEMHGILLDYLTYSSVIQLLSTAKLPKKVVNCKIVVGLYSIPATSPVFCKIFRCCADFENSSALVSIKLFY